MKNKPKDIFHKKILDLYNKATSGFYDPVELIKKVFIDFGNQRFKEGYHLGLSEQLEIKIESIRNEARNSALEEVANNCDHHPMNECPKSCSCDCHYWNKDKSNALKQARKDVVE